MGQLKFTSHPRNKKSISHYIVISGFLEIIQFCTNRSFMFPYIHLYQTFGASAHWPGVAPTSLVYTPDMIILSQQIFVVAEENHKEPQSLNHTQFNIRVQLAHSV